MLVNNSYYQNKKINFKSASAVATQALRFLNTNPSIGATSVDVMSMSAPRTIVDGINRGFDAGVETGFREGSGTANHALIGAYGLGASALLSAGINKAYNVKSNKIFANFDGIDTIGSIWHELVKNNPEMKSQDIRKKLFADVLHKVRANTHTQSGKIQKISIDENTAKSFMREISEFIDKNPNEYKIPSELFDRMKSIITHSTAAENEYVLKNANFSFRTNLETLIKSTFSLGKLFSEEKTMNTFKESSQLSLNKFVNMLKKTKLKSSMLGVSIAMAVGASVQPLNVWLTKKRTGKEGFVGVEGEKPDTSAKFRAKKAATALGFLTFAYATIVDNIFKTPFKKQMGQFLNRMQFNGLIPSIAQFKAVYAFTIASRLLSARSNNELRESETKDFLGFVNWLILGDFVQKSVASLSSKNLTNYDSSVHGKGIFNRIFNSRVNVKSHDEILFEELKKQKMPMSMLTSVDGKMLSAKELIKKYYDSLPNLKARIRGKNIAQLSGYLYSAVVLGILIPKLNIAITNHLQEKKKKHQEENSKFINSIGNGNFKIFYKNVS